MSTLTRSSIPVAKPCLGEEEVAAAARVIRSGWVTQGPEVRAFEEEFAAYVGAPFACAVSNCTAALHLALKAVGVGPGDEVITVSSSFIATANTIRYCGAVPVFVDIEPEMGNIDPGLIERAASPRTRAILCVHQFGMPCDLGAIIPVARRLGVPLVEDAACAVGSEIMVDRRWERIGKPHGDVACFSFHPRKLLTTGDGGMITTRDPDLDRRFRLWRQHGMSVSDTVRHNAQDVVFEEYDELGFNYRMTDIQAAVGREQLRRLPELVEQRRLQAASYAELLSAIPGLGVPGEPAWASTNWQSYSVRLPDGCDQQAVMRSLLQAGISSRRGVMASHLEPAYAVEPWRCGAIDCPGGAGCSHLSQSTRARDRSIILPLHHEMTGADLEHVVAVLAAACDLH